LSSSKKNFALNTNSSVVVHNHKWRSGLHLSDLLSWLSSYGFPM